MWVKICGTTSLDDAKLAANAGADAVGFVFAPSKRRVHPYQVARITPALPRHVDKVGVFHLRDADEIIAAVREAGLTAVQMHFPYDAAVVEALRDSLGVEYKLLQVVACDIETLDEPLLRRELMLAAGDGNIWGVLLDASARGACGGTGKAFDWVRVATILDQVWPTRHENNSPKLLLAGGLRQENLHEAIAALKPFGVDVVSGVEASPGIKVPNRVNAFIELAKEAIQP